MESMTEKILMLGRPAAVMMVGLPGSGKTTLAESIIAASRQLEPSTNIARISTDSIRQELTDQGVIGSGYDRATNEKVFEIAHTRTKATLDIGGIALIDATHLNKYRELSIAQYRNLGAATVAGLVLDVPVEVAMARNEARLVAGSGYVNPADIEKMEAFRLEHPLSVELHRGFDVVFEITPEV